MGRGRDDKVKEKKLHQHTMQSHRLIGEIKCNIDHIILIGFFFHLETDDLIYQLHISLLLVHWGCYIPFHRYAERKKRTTACNYKKPENLVPILNPFFSLTHTTYLCRTKWNIKLEINVITLGNTSCCNKMKT